MTIYSLAGGLHENHLADRTKHITEPTTSTHGNLSCSHTIFFSIQLSLLSQTYLSAVPIHSPGDKAGEAVILVVPSTGTARGEPAAGALQC